MNPIIFTLWFLSMLWPAAIIVVFINKLRNYILFNKPLYKGFVESPTPYPSAPNVPSPNSVEVQETKEHYLIHKNELKKMIYMMFDRPRMFAQSPESIEDQILLLVKIANPGVDIWAQYQFFKKDYIDLNAQSLSSKYTFDTTPSISDLMRKFVDEQYTKN